VTTALDETTTVALQFNTDGLIPAIVQHAQDKSVLMFAWMNAEALAKTTATGLVHFYSRSRKKLWLKGETSGETFKVVSICVDCDQDCLLVMVAPQASGKACHTGRASCFYRELTPSGLVFKA
jgi:phosphoribosyl-AMP cyclohydrolase